MEVVQNKKKWHLQVVNIYIVYEINLWPFTVGKDFILENSLFEAAKFTKNADFDKLKNILDIALDLMHWKVF